MDENEILLWNEVNVVLTKWKYSPTKAGDMKSAWEIIQGLQTKYKLIKRDAQVQSVAGSGQETKEG